MIEYGLIFKEVTTYFTKHRYNECIQGKQWLVALY